VTRCLLLLLLYLTAYMAVDTAAVSRERVRRKALLGSLFPEQRAAVLDPSHKKLLWTTRRAGKTHTILADFCSRAMARPRSKFVYVAMTQVSAEDIAWPILEKLGLKYDLKLRAQEHKLRMWFPNRSQIRLYGADRPGWMKKFYGQKLAGAAVDGAAVFTASLEDLIDDYLDDCLLGAEGEEDGVLYMTSIPGHFPNGLFYQITKQFDIKLDNWQACFSAEHVKNLLEAPSAAEWSCHRWTTMNNPIMRASFVAKREKRLKEVLNVTDDPKFVRNSCGVWYTDIGERVYAFDWEKNSLEGWKTQEGDRFVLGIDFGWDDRTAFSVVSWRGSSPLLVVLESYGEAEMRMDKIASYVRHYMNLYPGIQLVGDASHKQYFEEFRRRYRLPVMEGEKIDKFDWVQTMNADLLGGHVKFLDAAKSPTVAEMVKLPWLTKRDGRKIEQPGAANDCCDATLSAYRQAYHYRFERPEEKPRPGTAAYGKMIEDEMERKIDEQYEAEGTYDV